MTDETITITLSPRAMLATALKNGYQMTVRSSGGGPNPKTPGEFMAEFIAMAARQAIMELILSEGHNAAMAAAEAEVNSSETIRAVRNKP